ncbi:MAG: hypothetical protein K0B07_00465 [DPANN group archaeon]|nr:hypothetical protein [DPANN group archaeon]
MKTIFFVRPCHDSVTSYLHYYSKQLLNESEDRGLKTINKDKEDANREVVKKVINKINPDFIMFNGYGNPTMICEHNNDVIIEKDDNHDLFKDRIIYSLSCSSALELDKTVGG